MHRIYFRYLYKGSPWPKHLVWAIKELFGCDNLCIWVGPIEPSPQITHYPLPILHLPGQLFLAFLSAPDWGSIFMCISGPDKPWNMARLGRPMS